MSDNIITVAHVATDVDADCAIAALLDEGIYAAKQASVPSGSALLSMPGAMGFGAAEGMDILVNKAAEKKAREVLIGIGILESSEVDETEDIPAEEEPKQEASDAVPDEEKKVNPVLMILFLAALALFVIGVDKVIELIKSFLM